jgi:hypothetical protein
MGAGIGFPHQGFFAASLFKCDANISASIQRVALLAATFSAYPIGHKPAGTKLFSRWCRIADAPVFSDRVPKVATGHCIDHSRYSTVHPSRSISNAKSGYPRPHLGASFLAHAFLVIEKVSLQFHNLFKVLRLDEFPCMFERSPQIRLYESNDIFGIAVVDPATLGCRTTSIDLWATSKKV